MSLLQRETGYWATYVKFCWLRIAPKIDTIN